MKKITRKQRLELLKDGFYKCGFLQIENVQNLESDLERIADQLTEDFTNSVRATNTMVTISEIRSKDFIDSEGVYYDFKGMTYQHGQFLVHIYPHASAKSGSASITLIA